MKARSNHIYIIFLCTLLLNACGGGTGSSFQPNPTPETTKTKALILGTPQVSPVVIPPSADDQQIVITSIVSGGIHPEYLWLDEIDAEGNVIVTDVARLVDEGHENDQHRGDRIYSVTLTLNQPESTAKYYRVRAQRQQQTVASNKGTLWVSGCPLQARPSNPQLAAFDEQENADIYTNEVIITVNATPDLDELNKLSQSVEGRVVGCIPSLNQYLLEINNIEGVDGVYEAINVLRNHPDVTMATPNVQALSEDEDNIQQKLSVTALRATDIECNGEQCQWHLNRIRASQAWQVAGAGDPQQGVAVIDFGVNCDHPELNCGTNHNLGDDIDHGTGVASLINARNNDNLLTGVAWNTQIYPYKVVNNNSNYSLSQMITLSASTKNVKVINISAVTKSDSGQLIRQAVCKAIESGRLVVASAGNVRSSKNCQEDDVYPAKYNTIGECESGANLQKGLLVVGATDQSNQLAHWNDGRYCSNTLHVDMYAPGKNLFTASSTGGYDYKDGTSYAAPIVTGSAAVLWSAEPDLSVTEVHDRLTQRATTLNINNVDTRSRTEDTRMEGLRLLDLYQAIDEDLAGSTTPPDISPDPITFTAIDNADPSQLIGSNTVTISGINGPAPIEIIGGFYSINNGPFSDALGTLRNGDLLTLQVLSAKESNESVQASVSVGDYLTSFTVTTGIVGTTPEALSFETEHNVAIDAAIVSPQVTLSGLNTDTPIQVSGLEYSLDGGPFTSLPGVINNGQTLRLRITASDTPATATSGTVTLGAISRSFTVITEAADLTPNAFRFDTLLNVAPNTEQRSNTITIAGLNTEAVITVSNGEYSIDGAAFTHENGTIRNGQTLQLRHTSGRENDTWTNVQVGEYLTTFQTRTQAQAPDLRDIAALPALVNEAVSGWRFANNGGGAITNCSVTPTLPAGLSVRVTSEVLSCEIVGTPQASQAQTSYTVTATNAIGSSQATITIAINTQLSAPILSNVNDLSTSVNTLTHWLIDNSGGGELSSCSISPSLPAGLVIQPTIDGNDCLIVGTPTETRLSQFYTVTASNATGSNAASVGLGVNIAAPKLANMGSQVITRPALFNRSFSNTGGGQVTSCTSNIALPAGLTLSVSPAQDTCVISGFASAEQAAQSYIITATNSSGSDTASLTITVNPIPPALGGSDNVIIQNAATLIALNSDGGGSLTSCRANRAMPSGLSLNVSADRSTCEITGAATTVQPQQAYLVTGTNASGSSTVTVNLTVIPPAPQLLDHPDQIEFTDTPISIAMTNNGGGNLTTCNITPVLPGGLSAQVSGDTCIITGITSLSQGPVNYTVTASNQAGDSSANIIITINQQGAFITRWKTDNAGFSGDNQIKIGTNANLTYNYQIDWGDGNIDTNVTGNITHTYAIAGEYTISITGTFPQLRFSDIADLGNNSEFDSRKLLSIEQWGNLQWLSMQDSFLGCTNLVINAIDTPDLTQVTDMTRAFAGATNFNSDIGNWDVSNVTSMFGLFEDSAFNQDISSWNTANVSKMRNMFANTPFNQNIGGWNVSNVEDMHGMFSTTPFNQDISAWDVSNVWFMSLMFADTPFNQNIGNWDVSRAREMRGLFLGATFNQDISNWNVANVTDMNQMFFGNTAFNQNIGNWNVSQVTDMGTMFAGATSFNQDISNWTVSSVADMSFMFANSNFDQNIGNWNITSVTNMTDMFVNTTLSTANYDSLLQGWALQVPQAGIIFNGGNSTFSNQAQTARDTLINTHGWTITDGGPN